MPSSVHEEKPKRLTLPFLHGLPTLEDVRDDVLPLSLRHSSVSTVLVAGLYLPRTELHLPQP